jgi:hypothetical protein
VQHWFRGFDFSDSLVQPLSKWFAPHRGHCVPALMRGDSLQRSLALRSSRQTLTIGGAMLKFKGANHTIAGMKDILLNHAGLWESLREPKTG